MKTTSTSTEEERATIRLTTDLKNAVTERSKEEGISFSEYVRDVLSANLYGTEPKAPTTLSIDSLKVQIEKEEREIENLKTYLKLIGTLESLKEEKASLMKEIETKSSKNDFGKK